jgi:hypothetical protein
MGRNYEIIDRYLNSWLKNNLRLNDEILDDNISIHYSTIGDYQEKQSVLNALAWDADYAISTTTITNCMEYTDAAGIHAALIAHHMIANEKGPYLFPLCFGGKYVFLLERDGSRIKSVSYAQEYQAENTLYIKNWHLADRISDLGFISDFQIEKYVDDAYRKSDCREIAADLSKAFFWALDAQNFGILNQLTSKDIHIKRLKTMSYGAFEIYNQSQLPKFIQESKNYYSMDQYSFTIRGTEETKNSIVVHTSHLIPYRLGTKKLNTNTKYHSFYDEDIDITFIKDGNKYVITDINMKKIVDVHYNGFEVLHL